MGDPGQDTRDPNSLPLDASIPAGIAFRDTFDIA